MAQYTAILLCLQLFLYGVFTQTTQEPCSPFREGRFGAGRYYINWSADFDTETIYFNLIVQTPGFVGFGISNYTGMFDSDIIIGGIHDNGTVYFGDYHGVGQQFPILDESQDWILDFISDNGTHTHLSVHRPFNTGDQHDAVITDLSRTTFIWALGTSDVIQFGHASTDRGMIAANILSFPNCFPPTPSPCPVPNPATKTEVMSDDYVVSWNADMEQQRIRFEVSVRTTGFVGFGISELGGMNVADIVMGGVNANLVSYFGDYYGVGQRPPELDSQENWRLESAAENATHTVIAFSRAFDTGDVQDIPITDSEITVIWSFGGAGADDMGYHFGNRGARRLRILDPFECP